MDLDHAEFHRYIPPNREIYIEMLLQYLREEKQRIEEQKRNK